MEMRGFDRNYRSLEIAASGEPVDGVTWRDVELGPGAHTILLGRPLTLDLGGIAKGFAVDLAARELAPFRNFAIDAGEFVSANSRAHDRQLGAWSETAPIQARREFLSRNPPSPLAYGPPSPECS